MATILSTLYQPVEYVLKSLNIVFMAISDIRDTITIFGPDEMRYNQENGHDSDFHLLALLQLTATQQ